MYSHTWYKESSIFSIYDTLPRVPVTATTSTSTAIPKRKTPDLQTLHVSFAARTMPAKHAVKEGEQQQCSNMVVLYWCMIPAPDSWYLYMCVMWTLRANTSPGSDRLTKSSCEILLASSADNVPTIPPSRTRRLSRRHDARASKRPSVNGGYSLRGLLRGKLESITQPCDTRGDDRWRGPELVGTIEDLG